LGNVWPGLPPLESLTFATEDDATEYAKGVVEAHISSLASASVLDVGERRATKAFPGPSPKRFVYHGPRSERQLQTFAKFYK
jgi:hypothetical protein